MMSIVGRYKNQNRWTIQAIEHRRVVPLKHRDQMKKHLSTDYAARMYYPENESRWVDWILWVILILITIASVLVWWFKIRLS